MSFGALVAWFAALMKTRGTGELLAAFFWDVAFVEGEWLSVGYHNLRGECDTRMERDTRFRTYREEETQFLLKHSF